LLCCFLNKLSCWAGLGCPCVRVLGCSICVFYLLICWMRNGLVSGLVSVEVRRDWLLSRSDVTKLHRNPVVHLCDKGSVCWL
jgi:hypothetical protein